MINSGKFYEKSISSALSAIEIYNKPNFSQRSEVFTILMINAWEALLKGKILLNNSENVEAIYILSNDGKFKTNRSGAPMTLEIIGCCRKIGLPEIIINNLSSLIEIRDNAIHFLNDESVDYLVFTLGVASLKNYHKLCKDWFGDSIDRYNFYILPMGFVYNFKSIEMLELSKEIEPIQNILTRITENQNLVNQTQFEFVCEIEVNLKSAKKITGSTDLEIAINPEATTAAAIIRERRIVDSYPLTATELYKAVKKQISNIKRNEFFKYLAIKGIKADKKYSGYLFRNKRQKDNYVKDGILPKGISSLYNHDCLKYIIYDLQKKNNKP